MTDHNHVDPDEVESGFSTPVGSRRTFFEWVIGGATAIIGAVMSIPLIGYVISPMFKRHEKPWVRVGKLQDLSIGIPTALKHATTVSDGWLQTQSVKSVWAIRQKDNHVQVFSPICTHLGCGYRWNRNANEFQCPCHGSVFSISGQVLAGPAPRSLDTLPSKVEEGELFVVYKDFKAGSGKSIEL